MTTSNRLADDHEECGDICRDRGRPERDGELGWRGLAAQTTSSVRKNPNATDCRKTCKEGLKISLYCPFEAEIFAV